MLHNWRWPTMNWNVNGDLGHDDRYYHQFSTHLRHCRTSASGAGRQAAGALSSSPIQKYTAPAAWGGGGGASPGTAPCTSSRATSLVLAVFSPLGALWCCIVARTAATRLLLMPPPRAQTAQPPPLCGTIAINLTGSTTGLRQLAKNAHNLTPRKRVCLD